MSGLGDISEADRAGLEQRHAALLRPPLRSGLRLRSPLPHWRASRRSRCGASTSRRCAS
jgi:hypothetical protein